MISLKHLQFLWNICSFSETTALHIALGKKTVNLLSETPETLPRSYLWRWLNLFSETLVRYLPSLSGTLKSTVKVYFVMKRIEWLIVCQGLSSQMEKKEGLSPLPVIFTTIIYGTRPWHGTCLSLWCLCSVRHAPSNQTV
jgi:hypothetical protein